MLKKHDQTIWVVKKQEKGDEKWETISTSRDDRHPVVYTDDIHAALEAVKEYLGKGPAAGPITYSDVLGQSYIFQSDDMRAVVEEEPLHVQK